MKYFRVKKNDPPNLSIVKRLGGYCWAQKYNIFFKQQNNNEIFLRGEAKKIANRIVIVLKNSIFVAELQTTKIAYDKFAQLVR